MNQFQKHIENLKREYAMYWGCPCQIKYKRSQAYNSIVNSDTITLLSFPSSVEYIKLFLRPLSDMTKEEAKEFIIDILNFRNFFFRESDFNYSINNGFLSIEATSGNTPIKNYVLIKNWGKEGKGEWVFNMSYTMKSVQWLLERRFDVFGKIEKGEALETTINETN